MSESSSQLSLLIEGMEAAIAAFRENQLSIDRLAWELKSRIAALREVTNDEWVNELKSIWNQLEVVNAFFIKSGRGQLNLEEREEAEDIIGDLEAALGDWCKTI